MHLRWRKLGIKLELPELRRSLAYASATLVGSKILVYGGSSGVRHRDVFIYDIPTRKWSGVGPNESNRSMEPSFVRSMHTAVLVEDKLFIFGGLDLYTFTNDILAFDLILYKWEVQNCIGKRPHATAGHSCCYLQKRCSLLVYAAKLAGSLGSLFEYLLRTKQWRPVPTRGEEPSPRWKQASAFHNRRWFIYGGSRIELQCAMPRDLYILDTRQSIPVWSKISLPHSIPVNLQGPMTFFRNQLIFYRADKPTLEQVWSYDPTVKTASQFLPDKELEQGAAVNTIQGEFPSKRSAYMMLSNQKQVFVFGGTPAKLGNMHFLELRQGVNES